LRRTERTREERNIISLHGRTSRRAAIHTCTRVATNHDHLGDHQLSLSRPPRLMSAWITPRFLSDVEPRQRERRSRRMSWRIADDRSARIVNARSCVIGIRRDESETPREISTSVVGREDTTSTFQLRESRRVRKGWWGKGEGEREDGRRKGERQRRGGEGRGGGRGQRGAGALLDGRATCVTAERKREREKEREGEGEREREREEGGNHGAPHPLDDSQKAQQTNKQASRRTSKRTNE